jgi:hypothetical protein
MTDEFDDELEPLLDQIRAASPERWDPVPEDAAFCADCGAPDALRSWKGDGVCAACWADRAERAEEERQERLDRRQWEPKIQRIVPLGLDAEAQFVIAPEPRMVVIRQGQATIILAYFSPTRYSNAALIKKLGVYRTFS